MKERPHPYLSELLIRSGKEGLVSYFTFCKYPDKIFNSVQGGPMPGMRPTMGGPGIQPPQLKAGGSMGVLMPMYTIAIIVFFVYITFKVSLIILQVMNSSFL